MAAVLPNFTAVAPVKPVPVMVTAVAPAGTPTTGLTAVTVGAASYVNWSAEPMALVPLGVVTVTSTAPREPAGETAVIWVEELTAYDVAAVEPKLTALAPMKLVPVTVTDVPPVVTPTTGLTVVTVGAGS